MPGFFRFGLLGRSFRLFFRFPGRLRLRIGLFGRFFFPVGLLGLGYFHRPRGQDRLGRLRRVLPGGKRRLRHGDGLFGRKRGGHGRRLRNGRGLRRSGGVGVGGGGGVGDGPGGGGLYDVYVGQVMLLVQSHWSLPTYSRENLVVQVRIVQDASGHIQDCRIVRSSGRNDVDASAVNAVLRAKQLPPPPTPEQQELIITFNTQDMGGR